MRFWLWLSVVMASVFNALGDCVVAACMRPGDPVSVPSLC